MSKHSDEYIKAQLAKLAYKQCLKYLRDPVHREEFEEWYFQMYGHKWEERERIHNIYIYRFTLRSHRDSPQHIDFFGQIW